MAINKKGLRKITVDNNVYYWRYAEGAHIYQEIQFGEIHVDFGRFPSWLDVGNPDYKKDTPKFEQRTLTPKYIRQAILFARKSGWRSGKMSLIYRDGTFKILES